MDILRTQNRDVDFHRARRMFCIKDGETKIAPEGSAMSHLEWFEAEGWITKSNVQEFMDATVRGIFLPARHALFFYKGMGFFFDDAVVSEAIHRTRELMAALTLDSRVSVYVGPPDAIIHGAQYRQEWLGTVESALKGNGS